VGKLEQSATSAAPKPLGSVAFVFHSHLPWVLGHGVWPVGEEWLYQIYAHSYIPLFDALSRLGHRGFHNIVSLGITPILGVQLDHPRGLSGLESWLHNWQLRALHLPQSHPLRNDELASAHSRLELFRSHFSRGAAPVLRQLIDTGVIEFLGGPATHPFTPGLDPRIHHIALKAGLDEASRRYGHRPKGIWVPECAYRPGQENLYEMAGVTHFMVDEPAITAAGGQPGIPYRLGGRGVTTISRDATMSDLLWSHERGFGGASPYRDFHHVDAEHGLKLGSIGDIWDPDKNLYDPDAAKIQIEVDARTFLRGLEQELTRRRTDVNSTPTIVIGIDTELLGHWWHEGVTWFERVIELLPECNITTKTLRQTVASAHMSIDLQESSWGSGKHWSVWTGAAVRDLVVMNHQGQEYVLHRLDQGDCTSAELNQLMLQLSSDWAFMVTRDSAADYARSRAISHFYQLTSGSDRDHPFPLIRFNADQALRAGAAFSASNAT